MSEDETRLRKSYSQQNEEENNMDIKTVFTEVWHAGWTFGKAMYASLIWGGPIGYFDPRVNTRVASQIAEATGTDPAELAYDFSVTGSNWDSDWDFNRINPATGYVILPGSAYDVGGNPYGLRTRHDWD